MENKNFYKSCNPEFTNRLFFESRLLMKNDPAPQDKGPAAEEPEKSPKRKPAEVKDEKESEAKGKASHERSKFKTKVGAKEQREQFKKEGKFPGKKPEAAGRRDPEKEKRMPRRGPEKTLSKIKLPKELKLDIQVYLEKNFRDEKTGPGIEKWSLGINAEKTQINWQSWDHSTVEGVQKIYDDCQDLNLINQNADYYNTTFAILRNSADKSINTNLATDDIRNAFLKPADPGNREKIAALPPIAAVPPNGEFPGGEAFLKAFDHLTYIKAQVYALNTFQKDTLKKQREMGEDPVAGKVTDFVRSNVATFQKAIRERDYATAGVYALGAYALWQTLGKKIFGGDGHAGGDAARKGFDYKKWLLIGAAVYCGNKFAKNAGYDILKMTGFKTGDAEVAGTPMEVLSNILHKSEFSEQTKDLDYGIVLTMSETSLTTLEDLRKQSNKKGIDFIHPREFPALFPDIKNAWPFKMGLGEEGLKDYIGMSNTKLGPKEKEYIRVGQQIYKLSLAMQATYDGTLHQHNKNFRDKTYQDVLKRDPFKDSKVRHLMAAVHEYANERVPGGLFSGKKKQEIQALLNENLEKSGLKGESFALENEIQEGTRHYWAKLHGFPVVVVASSTGYRVYLRGDYGKAYNSAPGPGIAEIPLQGPGAKSAMETIIKAIEKKMRELVDKSPILGNKTTILSSLKYVNGQWQCEVDDPAIADLDIAGGKSIVPINPDEDGMSIIGQSLDRKSRFPTEILPRLVNQPQFHALSIFLGAGKLDAKYNPSRPGKFTVVIGKKKQIEVEIAYDQTKKSFSFADPTKEAELFKSGSGFAEELKDALGENNEMKQVFDDWKKVLEETPKDYFYNFFKKVPNWFTMATLDHPVRGFRADQFSGSVAKNYTLALMEAQKEFLLSKVGYSVNGANSLADMQSKMDAIMAPALKDWQLQLQIFSQLNTKNFKEGKEFSKEAFQEGVLKGLANVGTKSTEYRKWSKKFTDEIFTREGNDDLWDAHTAKGRDVVKIFAYYTAPLDDQDIDGVDLNFKLTPQEEEKVRIIQSEEKKLGLKVGASTSIDSVIFASAIVTGASKTPPIFVTMADLELTKTQNRKEKFLLYSDYADYVVGKIYLKINKGELKGSSVPGPGAWGIESFDEWNKHPGKFQYEFVDREPALKMSRNYIPLDEYLLLTPPEKNQILATRREDIILPRKNTEIKRYINASGKGHLEDKKIIFEVFGVNDERELQDLLNITTHDSLTITDKVRKMEIEQIFIDTFKNAINHLKKKYVGRINENKFDAILRNYSLDCSVENFDKDPTNKTFHVMDFRYQRNSNLADKVQELESRWSTSGARFSRTDQIIEIKRLIGEIIEKEVLPGEKNYINYESLTDKGVNAVKEFWAWIWH